MARITLLDGGMGQELVARSGDEPTPLWATRVMIDHPGMVRAIHEDYFAAGATDVYLPLHSPGRVTREADLDGVLASIPAEPNSVKMISYHPQGTCRMGTDPATSVVNADGRVHAVEGLYVADASLFPTSILVNPQMTVYALAKLVADNLATEATLTR